MKRRGLLKSSGYAAAVIAASPKMAKAVPVLLPVSTQAYPDLRTSGDHGKPDHFRSAFHFALGFYNIREYKAGLIKNEEACLCAGADYKDPWTRDAAINTRNGVGLIFPDIAKLLSCLDHTKTGLLIAGQ